MPAQTAPQQQPSEQALLAANRTFYAAFESLDISQMEAIWVRDDTAQCVHPGWELLLGWEEVRESWVRIFSNAKRVKISLSSIWIRVEGNVGWVSCTEHITTAFAEGFDDARVQATNLFVQREGQWRLVSHHASPLPHTPAATVQ